MRLSQDQRARTPPMMSFLATLLLIGHVARFVVALPLDNSRNITNVAFGPSASCTATTVSQAHQHISSGCQDIILKNLKVPAVGPGGTALALSLKKGQKVEERPRPLLNILDNGKVDRTYRLHSKAQQHLNTSAVLVAAMTAVQSLNGISCPLLETMSP
jgi:hypothetical protein